MHGEAMESWRTVPSFRRRFQAQQIEQATVADVSMQQPTIELFVCADPSVLNTCFEELDPRLRHVLQACNSRHTPDKMRSGRGISIRSSSAETVFFDSSAFPSCLLSPASAPGSRTEKRKKLLRSKTYGEDTT
eukprot:TRINITY_DN31937_c0_g1_i2.p1 TRINITY_DN31937_c0_g1~~TRINITY_DN31937_c0_g1_i2.p1  ORF type:complete len:133 (-),score=9.61 TRINITY_DN31937_c0_g1_i2:1475-1873(-)